MKNPRNHSSIATLNELPAATRREDRERIARINGAVRAASRDVRARHPFLRHQDAIGLILLLLGVGAAAAAGAAYLVGVLPASATIVLVALGASIAHEIEHDLIHLMYFRKNRVVHAAMMALCWLVRPNTINPWFRKELHLYHHKMSGTPTDLEERAITNGEPFDLKRLVMMADGVAALLFRLPESRRARRMVVVKFIAGYFPLGWVHFPLWYAFLGVHAARAVWGDALFPGFSPVYDAAVVLWVAPNVLRSFCLNFMSSSMHYYGDVTPGNVLEQTQVLNARRFLPLQLFCFNFGSTHAIHHFVANEPFYVRQWTAAAAHAALRENGVPFNDFGTFRRANRRHDSVPVAAAVVAGEERPLPSRP
jgi:fatty acid desaturase